MRERANELYQSAKKRAKKLNIRFSLTREWIEDRLRIGHCELTNVQFVFESGQHPASPSIDRRNPSKGYTKANCRLCSFHINSALNQWSDDAFTVLSLRYLMTKIPEILQDIERNKRAISLASCGPRESHRRPAFA